MTPKEKILDACMPHVAFDGWSEETFRQAVSDAGIEMAEARSLFPKGALDLAAAFHQAGDLAMTQALASENLLSLRYRDRVARAIRIRLEYVAGDKEAVRRGTTLFSLPQHAADGAKLIWGTADAIWNALGDSSQDFNWYTKRATLSGVYGATVLYWLGDESENHQATWEFLDRRIDNVMQFEKVKAQMNANPVISQLMTGPNWLMSQIKAPSTFDKSDLPGSTK